MCKPILFQQRTKINNSACSNHHQQVSLRASTDILKLKITSRKIPKAKEKLLLKQTNL